MEPVMETKRTATFLLSALGTKIAIKLYKRKHTEQIIFLKKIPRFNYSLGELGEILYSMEYDQKKGVYNGVDYLKILNVQFL